jgi:hypothetical protein
MHGGSEFIDPCIPDLGNYLEVTGQLHAPTALPSDEKASDNPLDRRMGGPQNRSGRHEEDKHFAPRCPTRNQSL